MSYAYPVKNGDFLPPYLYFAPLILVLIVFLLYLLKVPRKILIVGLSFFFINITLSQSVMLIDNFMANRYAGLAYLGLFLILADFSERIMNAPLTGWQSKLKIGWVALLVVFAVGFSWLTYSRNFVWKDTVTLFDDVIQKQPNLAWVYSNRGIAKYMVGDYDNALKDFNQALVIDPNFTLSFYYRGVLEYIAGNYQVALEDLDHTLYNDPLFADGYLQRAKIRIELNDTQGAMDDLNQTLALDPYMMETYLTRGMLKNNLGDYQGALADFDMLISYEPNNGTAFYMRSIAKRNLNDQAGSCADAAHGVELGYQPTPEQIDPNCQ
jgi:tetratricopeptide (TPR) repeat protein